MLKHWQALGLLTATLIAAPGAAANPSISVTNNRCGAEVTVVARNVPLSQVLDELAEALSFSASVEPAADHIVNVSISAPAGVVIAALTRHDNVILVEEYDPDCGGLRRPVRVAVLEGQAPSVSNVGMESLQAASDQEPLPQLTRLTRHQRFTQTPEQADEKDESEGRQSGRGIRRRDRN